MRGSPGRATRGSPNGLARALLQPSTELGPGALFPGFQDVPLFLEDNVHTALALPSSKKLSASHLVANSWAPSLEKPDPAIPWVKDWLSGPALGQGKRSW